jgi:hypothetical protein
MKLACLIPSRPADASPEELRSNYYVWFIRSELSTGRPKEIVMWRIWMGGFREVMTIGLDESGCDFAGRLFYEVGAENYHTKCRVTDPRQLMSHAKMQAWWDEYHPSKAA